MKMVQSSDYRIYFDDVRMDPYVKSWNTACGLNASDATANIVMNRTERLENWKGYLTQVRVFVRNNFSGKYSMVFEGEVMTRSWGHKRADTGDISFQCKGFYHWLNVPIPLMVADEDAFDHIQRFRYEAQNIDVEAMQQLFTTEADISMRGAPISEVIDRLFDVMNAGYYIDDDSSFHWAKLKDRMKVMADIIPEFRDTGYLDIFTFIRSTQIETFYVYLNTILSQMMFEFYQDRDGALRVKTPSWSDAIPQCHIFDESVIQKISGFDNWENEPTRVLVVGGMMDPERNMQMAQGYGNQMTIPMGLYIGTPSNGEYFQKNIDVLLQEYGIEGDSVAGSGFGGEFFNNLTPTSTGYRVTSPYGHRNPHPVHGGPSFHRGTDFGTQTDPLYNIGAAGVVSYVGWSTGGGNGVRIDQTIDGTEYTFVYLHLSQVDVKKGDRVSPGQKIGNSGATGEVKGAHLHFEVWRGGRTNGAHIDPVPFLRNMNKKNEQKKEYGPQQHGGGQLSYGYGPQQHSGGQLSYGDGPQSQGDSYGPQQHSGGQLSYGGPSGGSSGGTQVQDYVNQSLHNQSNLTSQEINDWINSKIGSHRKNISSMYNRGADFYLASQKSGLDPLYLVSHAAHETEWGVSDIVRDRNNFYGIGAVDHNPYNRSHRFVSIQDGIVRGAVWIKENYFDRGQDTLYKMRFSPSGNHDYATDEGWHTKIANTMRSSGYRSGSNAGFTTNSSAGEEPFSNTGGSLFQTRVSSSYSQKLNGIEPLMTGQYQNYAPVVRQKPEPVNYNADARRGRTRYPIPSSASSFEKFLKSDPNGMDHNMIAAVIDQSSRWREKHQSNGRYGLMGVPESYMNDVLGGQRSVLMDPELNIENGTKLFKNGFDMFTEKPTFALATLFTGSLTTVQEAIGQAGIENFAKVRNYLDSNVVSFVDGVIDVYTDAVGGNVISGDPHKDFLSDDGSLMTESLARDTDVKDYEAMFRPTLSDEERLYKVNLKISEQPLIRKEISDPGSEGNMDADDLVQRYARYMMQLYRAQSHGASVSFATGMPFIRPGFNAWVEPTRTDVVFYVTNVQHQGSFDRGAFTSVNGAFMRDPGTYDDIEENIFVSRSEVTASDFGATISRDDMESMRERLDRTHDDDQVISDGRKAPVLNEIYSSMRSGSNYQTQWTKEMTSDEIHEEIRSIYSDATPIIKDRKAKLAGIMRKSAEFFKEMLHQQDYD